MYKIISVGGSIIIPKTGFDVKFLKKFRDLIIGQVKKGDKFILVIGGGATARQYQTAGRGVGLNSVNLDWLGIYGTKLNAEFVRLMFGKYAYSKIVVDPTNKLITNKPIIIAAGYKPGWSTDNDAVLLAQTYGAKEVVNLSNIDYVYSSDPKKNSNAKKYKNLTWAEFRKIVGDKWNPGANTPFDPIASKLAQKLKLTLKFAKGSNLAQVKNIISGKDFLGSIIN